MSRRRYISTDISHDTKFNRLARECGDFPALLYILIIPHAGDDGILRGDPEELSLKLVPGRKDKTPQDIEDALKAMERLGLLTWQPEQRAIYLNPATFYKYQTYIQQKNRRNADDNAPGLGDQPELPSNHGNRRESPQKAVSPSPSPSPTPSLSPTPSPSLIPPLVKDAEHTATAKKSPIPGPGDDEASIFSIPAYARFSGSPGAVEIVQRLIADFPDVDIEHEARRCVEYGAAHNKPVTSVNGLDSWCRGAKRPLAKKRTPAVTEEEQDARNQAQFARDREARKVLQEPPRVN